MSCDIDNFKLSLWTPCQVFKKPSDSEIEITWKHRVSNLISSPTFGTRLGPIGWNNHRPLGSAIIQYSWLENPRVWSTASRALSSEPTELVEKPLFPRNIRRARFSSLCWWQCLCQQNNLPTCHYQKLYRNVSLNPYQETLSLEPNTFERHPNIHDSWLSQQVLILCIMTWNLVPKKASKRAQTSKRVPTRGGPGAEEDQPDTWAVLSSIFIFEGV